MISARNSSRVGNDGSASRPRSSTRRARAGASGNAAEPAAVKAMDVWLMNTAANLMLWLLVGGALLAAAYWLLRAPLFPIRSIQIEGDMQRNNVPTLRANAAPHLSGNFFSLDLQHSRRAFESVPWVRRAEVRRVWPDTLSVRLQEHRAVALWDSSESGLEPERLVNEQGEVFDANLGDVQDDKLPTLAGPSGTAPQMLALYRQLAPQMAQLRLVLERLQQSERGSWRAELEGGAHIELGRGTEQELLARAERFVSTFATATREFQAPLAYADLRHSDGYAVRLSGIEVASNPAAPKAAVKAR